MGFAVHTPTAAVRRLLLLSFLQLLLHSPWPLVAQGQGQQLSTTKYIYGLCNTAKYASNSTFALNLNTVISILTQKAAAGESYYLTNSTQGSDNTSWAYGMFQCRSDLSAEECSSCLSAIIAANLCGAAFGLRIQYLGCYHRYEYSDFTGLQLGVLASNCSSQKNSSSAYQSDLTTALNRTSSSAGANGGYAAATVGSAHALSQCLGYLSASDCNTCLSQSSSRTSICDTSSSGYFYYVACYYLFSDTNLLFSNSTSSSSSSSPSTDSPSPSPTPALALGSGSAISPSPAALFGSGLINSPPAGSSSSSHGLSAAAIAGLSVGTAVVVLAVLLVACAAKRRRSKFMQLPMTDAVGGTTTSANNQYNFTIQELRAATDNFNGRNKIGQGGFGVVYKGTLRNGKEVAIKIISPGDHRGKEINFMNEAKLISTVQHRNLIQLLGCATDDSRWYLVCEYLPNRSLDLHLFGNNGDDARELTWKTRFNIISCIAKGLCYLHEDSHVRIVHRDIKAANILLDGNLEPKIADFGLARLFSDDVSHLTTAVAGTLGYMPPEYAMGGQLSEKVDVYSFGMVTLEIVSGRKVIENSVEDAGYTHILEWAWDLYEKKQVAEMVDRRIMGSANEWEVVRAVHVALLCTQAKPQARPAMSQVYMMLSSQSAILEVPSRPGITSMGIFSASNTESQTSSSAVTNRHHINDSASSGTSDQTMERYGNMSWIRYGSSDKATEENSQSHSQLDGSITELHAR